MRTRFKVWLWILVAIMISRFIGMVLLPFMDTTEPRYAEIARLMAETGDWITPWFEPGVPFWGKPPLSFWAQAAAIKALGLSEFSLRFPAWVATSGIIWLTWALSNRVYGELIAAWSTIILSTMALTYVSAGAVMTDTFLVFGTTLSLVSFWFATSGPTRIWRWMFFVGIAVGLLAKGPLALVLIGAPIAFWLMADISRLVSMSAMPWMAGSLLAAAIALPWYVLAELKTPGFLDYFIIGEHFRRFVDPGWSGDLYGSAHRQPTGMVWIFWIWATFPWGIIGLLIWGLRAKHAGIRLTIAASVRSASALYLLLCASWPMVFFTVAGNLIWTYVLPALPFAAILIASGVYHFSSKRLLWLRSGAAALSPVLITTFVIVGISGIRPLKTEKELVSYYNEVYQAGDSPLFYVGKTPFSARFYSQGGAVTIKGEKLPDLLLSNEYDRLFLAIPHKRESKLLEGQPSRGRKLMENRKFRLFYFDDENLDGEQGAL